jgi:hypothetical protein
MKILPPIAAFLLTLSAFGQRGMQGPHCTGVIHGTVLLQGGRTASGLDVNLYPIGVDLDYVLPHMKTDEAGGYSFDHVCPGKYTVLPADGDAGYSDSDYYFLYARRPSTVKITKRSPNANLIVNLPPKAAQLRVRLANSKTKAKIEDYAVKLTVTKARTTEPQCGGSDGGSCGSESPILVPPDQDVFVHITSDGFHEWRESVGSGKRIHVPSGEILTIDAELEPAS